MEICCIISLESRNSMLEEIIKNNPELSKVHNLVDILTKIESIIPEDLRERFYYNLKTLHIQCSSEHDESYYDYRKNTITINPGYNRYLLGEWSQDERKEKLLLIYESTLCHELIHMTSTKYNKEEDKVNSGFLNIVGRNPSNYYLNEGFTELLSEQIYPQAYLGTGYKDTIHIAALISNLVGSDIIKEIYFSDKTVDDLKTYLQCDCEEMFSCIEAIPYDKASNDINYYNHHLFIIIRQIAMLIDNTVRKWIENGVFNSKVELEDYYNQYLYPNIMALINILKFNNFNHMGALIELGFDNFISQYDDLFKSSIKK